MPRVLHIITRLTLGGAQETALYYFHHLEREKFDVFFMAGTQFEFQEEAVLEALWKDANFTCIKNLDNRIHPIKDLLSIWEIYKGIKRNKIDIVHTHSAKAGFVGRVAARLAKVSVIIHTVHGWSFNPLMKPLIKKIYIFLEKLMAKCTTQLIVVSNPDIEKGLAHGIGRLNQYKVIRSGIDFTKFTILNEKDILRFKENFPGKRLIGAVGRLSAPKNYRDFVKIAKELCRRREDLHFVIVGEGELRAEIEEYISQNKLKDKVTLLGLRRDVNLILRSLDVLLLPSLWEGLPRVLPEAMYCELPIVANRVDGVEEIIIDGFNGLLVAPKDCLGAVASVEKLLENFEFSQRLVENAKQGVYEYSAQKMIEDTQNLYRELYGRFGGGE